MKHKITLYIIALVNITLAGTAGAQQVYTSTDYGSPGTQQLYSRHLQGFTDEEITLSGADTIWNVSHLMTEDLLLQEIVTHTELIDLFTFTAICGFGGINALACVNIYNNTQQAWLQNDTASLIQFSLTDLQRYQRKTSARLLETFFGFTADLAGGGTIPAVIVYPTPDTVLNFPVMFGDSLSSAITWSLDLSPTGQNIQYSSRQFRTSKVDGWGTLITPFDTLEGVLRVRAEIQRMDTLTTDTLTIPVNLTQIEYTWYDTAFGLPVMIAQEIANDTLSQVAVFSYLVDAECGSPEFSVSTDSGTYFIDTSGSASVIFETNLLNADYLIWDFDDGSTETTNGDVTHVYNAPGFYTVIVSGCLANCLPLSTCATDTVLFEIVDTTSAVNWISPEDHGIRIFPNPASDVVNIYLPEPVQSTSYVFFNRLGVVVSMGRLDSGWNGIDIDYLPGDVYLVRIIDDSGTRYKAVRVLVTE